MCELLCVSAGKKIFANDLLKNFFEHSVEHPNGWGLAVLDGKNIAIEREPVKARNSLYLKNRLTGNIESARFMAHIRKATIGEESFSNTHPFVRMDESGRNWVLMHNGTIFDSRELSSYQYEQEGTTDSERILLYLVDCINERLVSEMNSFDVNQRFHLVDEMVRKLAKGNKLNLVIYDGDYFYIHKNEADSLYKREHNKEIVISTRPLTNECWEEVPTNRLLVYRDGEKIFEGKPHHHTYVHNEERYKMLYLDYAGL